MQKPVKKKKKKKILLLKINQLSFAVLLPWGVIWGVSRSCGISTLVSDDPGVKVSPGKVGGIGGL